MTSSPIAIHFYNVCQKTAKKRSFLSPYVILLSMCGHDTDHANARNGHCSTLGQLSGHQCTQLRYLHFGTVYVRQRCLNQLVEHSAFTLYRYIAIFRGTAWWMSNLATLGRICHDGYSLRNMWSLYWLCYNELCQREMGSLLHE